MLSAQRNSPEAPVLTEFPEELISFIMFYLRKEDLLSLILTHSKMHNIFNERTIEKKPGTLQNLFISEITGFKDEKKSCFFRFSIFLGIKNINHDVSSAKKLTTWIPTTRHDLELCVLVFNALDKHEKMSKKFNDLLTQLLINFLEIPEKTIYHRYMRMIEHLPTDELGVGSASFDTEFLRERARKDEIKHSISQRKRI